MNKVSSAIHLRFDIGASSLPGDVKDRLLQMKDRRITDDGIVVIKAQQHRSQEMNRDEALSRLHELVRQAAARPVKRIATRPPRSSKRRRLEDKVHRARVKALRGKVTD